MRLQVIILNKNNFELLHSCVTSIIEKTKYSNYGIIIADTGSNILNLRLIKGLKEEYPNIIKVVAYDSYHFEKVNNDIVQNYLDDDTELVLFCNNDIMFISDCITEMVNTLKTNDNVGTVGARLYYKNNSIQHHGIKFSLEDGRMVIGHNKLGEFDNFVDEPDTLVIGNTAALQLVNLSFLKEINYFPETYIDSLSDVEFNLQCLLAGKKNILCGKALSYHFESQTRKAGGRLQMKDYQTLQTFIETHNEIRNLI